MRLNGKKYEAEDKVALTEKQAFEARHALVDGPSIEDDPDEDYDEDEEEALQSIKRRPDNPDSGVDLYWKTKSGLFTKRPESNKTQMELEREPTVRRTVTVAKAAIVKATGTFRPEPVIPVALRQTPQDYEKTKWRTQP
jgi:hypothetical protein